MRTLLSVFTFLQVLFLCSCASESDIDTQVIINYNEEFTLRVGQTAISPDSTTVSLIDIPTDSRCATSVNCVWEGEIVAALEGSHGGVTIPIEIKQSIAQSALATANFVRFRLELLEVSPYPDLSVNNGQIEPEDYVLTFVLREQ